MRHVHRNDPLRTPVVIGHLRDGSPVLSMAGGADGDGDEGGEQGEDDDVDDQQQDDDVDGGEDDDEELGEKGQKALERMKAERRDLKRQLREAKAQNRTAKTNDGEGGSDEEKTAEQLREEIAQELREANSRDRALDKLEVRAARTFADPEDARALLAGKADDFLDEEGNPDVEAIDEELAELLEKKPHLAAQGGKWKGGGDGGARRSKPTRAKSIGDAVGRHYTPSS